MDTSFAAASAVRRERDGVYGATLDAAYAIEGSVNGGLLLAIQARAGMQATGTTHPHAVSASFLRPTPPGPVQLHVEVLRRGRTATYVRSTMYRHDVLVVEASLVLGRPSVTGQRAQPPFSLPPPEHCQPAAPIGMQGLLDRLSVRFAPGYSPADPAAGDATDPAALRAWIEPLPRKPADALFALMSTDVLAPSVRRLGYRGWAPTVQLTAHVHAVPSPGPLAAQCTAGSVRDGWFGEETVVLDTAGTIVARAHQLARVPRRHQAHPAPALDSAADHGSFPNGGLVNSGSGLEPIERS